MPGSRNVKKKAPYLHQTDENSERCVKPGTGHGDGERGYDSQKEPGVRRDLAKVKTVNTE